MAVNERLEHRLFIKAGFAIARRAPRQDIGDVSPGAIEIDRSHHFVEQLSCPTHKGQPLQILITTRRFADEHDIGVRVAITKDQIFGREFEAATVKICECLLQFSQSGGAFGPCRCILHQLGAARILDRSTTGSTHLRGIGQRMGLILR